MMKRTSLICGILLIALLLGVVTGCAKPSPEPSQSTNGADDTKPADTSDPDIADTLAPKYDFNEDYRILAREEFVHEFDDSNGTAQETVKAAIYSRNKAVEQRANVTIKIKSFPGDWNENWLTGEVATLLRGNFNSGVSQYELIAAHSVYLSELSLEGIGCNLAELPNVDLSKKWWSSGFYRESNYNGAQYFMVGDICLTLYELIQVVFFNENYLRELDDEIDLYDLASDGKWTFAVLKQYAELVNTDDTDPDTASYGFVSNGHCHRAIATAFDINLFPLDEDGKRTCLETVPESASRKVQEYIDWFRQTPQTYGFESIDDTNKMFATRRALFYANQLRQATRFRDIMTDDYGVLPFPKYDENQLSYRSCGRDTMSVVMVPVNVGNRELAGTVLEMMCMESRFNVTTAYYETVLKFRSFEDERCVAMLDMILDSMNPIFSSIYSSVLNYPASLLGRIIQDFPNGTQFSTMYVRERPGYVQGLSKLYEDLDKLAARDAQ